ncbi:hypothetical protein PA598K_06088 [Paenibacillus sp. 598K]|uniref:hypothetical protein n=1 Tax=Paenibacillus sp. 598K TaxID=1117987 RepID=UPI000FF919BA|nr:hypothetical protein [Paenibacillus sp. 598K]GBF77534.1 hypothetical protein PA598K_06088 [Paenibacillus sp. 598K]
MAILIVIGAAVLLFLYKNWTIMQYKSGSKPVVLNELEPTDTTPQGETIRLPNSHRWIDEWKIGVTDFYYVEGLDALRFGLWYRKWDYDNVSKVVEVELVDDAGTRYETYAYTNLPDAGVYETFQIREIRGINLPQVTALTMMVKPEHGGEAVAIPVYAK